MDGCQSGLLSFFAKEMSFIKTTTGSNPVPSSIKSTMGRNYGGRCERVAARVRTEVPCFHTHTHMESWQSLVHCIGLENRRTVMFREFKSHTFLQSHDTHGTPLYHRIDYLRVFYSAGILRVDLGIPKIHA